MEDHQLSEKIVEMLAKGQISLNNCQVNLGGQNTMNCGIAEKKETSSSMDAADISAASSLAKNAVSCLSETAGMPEGTVLPEALNRAECLAAFKKLKENHLMDADYQPIGMTWSERGILVEELSSRFAIDDKWQLFGTLWHMKPQVLRSAYNKAMDMKKTSLVFDRIRIVLAD